MKSYKCLSLIEEIQSFALIVSRNTKKNNEKKRSNLQWPHKKGQFRKGQLVANCVTNYDRYWMSGYFFPNSSSPYHITHSGSSPLQLDGSLPALRNRKRERWNQSNHQKHRWQTESKERQVVQIGGGHRSCELEACSPMTRDWGGNGRGGTCRCSCSWLQLNLSLSCFTIGSFTGRWAEGAGGEMVAVQSNVDGFEVID